MMTVCAFLRAKTGNMVSILQITFRKIDAADFADTPLFGKIQKEEKLNSTKKRKSDLLAEIACYLFIHVFFCGTDTIVICKCSDIFASQISFPLKYM